VPTEDPFAVNRTYALIPARWDSSRFPGKPLHLIAGKPLVQHVWERCREASGLSGIVVATDDERIAEAARGFGAEVCMTAADHPSGTDRIAEAAAQLEGVTHVINVQGDEPMIDPKLISELAAKMAADPKIEMITAANEISNDVDLQDPNVVKVVMNQSAQALYFSRSVIPFQRKPVPGFKHYRHKGIYGFTREFLLRFVRWDPSPLELMEQLEQLRALDNGASIHVVLTDDNSIGVDVPEQAEIVTNLLLTNKHS
jgi:3-deoxy-manno-octulosonate cytidylyltransferase (CMP-KDO synthetase)